MCISIQSSPTSICLSLALTYLRSWRSSMRLRRMGCFFWISFKDWRKILLRSSEQSCSTNQPLKSPRNPSFCWIWNRGYSTGEISQNMGVMTANLFIQKDFQERRTSTNVLEQRNPIRMGKCKETSLISSRVRTKFLLRKQRCLDLGSPNLSSDPWVGIINPWTQS